MRRFNVPSLPLVAACLFAIPTFPSFAAAQDAGASTPQTVTAEAQLDFTFEDALLDGRGTRSLRELRGKLLLIEFWGRR